MLFFNRFKGRSIVYLFVGGFIPVIYIVFLLVFNYQNNLALQESSTKRFKLDIEKQAATIGYFLLERKYDIRTMADSLEVMTYFDNRDMGMSEQYGLKVSLFSIHQLMQNIFREKTIKNDSIYKNFIFINSDKKTLIDMASPNQTKNNFPWKLELDAVKDEPELIFEKTEHGYKLLLASPCFFKRRLSGWMVAWLDLDTLDRHFMGSPLELSFMESRLTLENGRVIDLSNKMAHHFPWETLQKKIAALKDKNLIVVNNILPGELTVLLIRVQIHPFPLSLTGYVLKNELLGQIETWQYLAGTGALMFLLFFGLGLFIQADTKHLILKTRFDESKKQHDLLSKKNRQLKESEERYRKLFESSSDAILIVMENRIIDCNRKTIELLELDHEEIIDQTLYTFSPTQQPDGILSDKKYLEIIDKAFKVSQSFDWTLKTKNNKLIETEVNMTALSIGSDTCIQVIMRDITERKQAENEKIQAQKIAGEQKKLALIGQVAGKMAHDFNNVLSIIMGNSELALVKCEDDQARETFELIFKQTLRGKNLTKNLVAFAKSQEPKQEFFKINEKIDLVLNLMKKDLEDIAVIKDDEADMPVLLADPGMIEHALVNLIQNSIHALSKSEYPQIMIRTYCINDNIFFEVEDNGCGISKQHLEKIYEPSFTMKGSKDITGSYKTGIKGTGYGMANVKKYIDQHKGTILVESELNSGTKITICLPVVKKGLTPEEKTKIQKEITHFGKYILLVEDEMAISNVQYKILTQAPCSHNVDIADNGKTALELFDKNRYDFISLDYVLSGEINGMSVYNHIRKINKTVPILFVSGNIEFLESIKGLKQKDLNIDNVSKPCKNMDYISSINRLLEESLAVKKSE